MQRFKDKIIIVTGAASGIGRETAKRLASEGGTLFCVDLNETELNATVTTIIENGGAATSEICDVASESSVKSCVDSCLKMYGRIDVLCNIAGILRFVKTTDLTLEDWNKTINVNLTSVFLMCRECLPHLTLTKGNIVNISSSAGLSCAPYSVHYSASKAGILALTRALAVEYAHVPIRVNSVCPAAIVSEMTMNLEFPEGIDRSLLDRQLPITGLGKPEQVVGAIALLASNDDASHINGTALRVDGGALT